jgi:hypothetical protein
MTRHKHAEVLIAIAEGREVEYSYDFGDNWNDAGDENPIAHDGYEWRVKPVPVIRYEWLIGYQYAFDTHYKPAAENDDWELKITFEDDKPIKVEIKS